VTDRIGRAWRRLQRVEGGRRAAPTLFVLALLVYALVAVAFPLAAGRDLGTYLRAAFELRSSEVVLPQAMLGRAPVTGVFSEAVLSVESWAAEAAMALLYALSILCWWRVARRLGPAVGVAVPLVLLLFPGYALLFHRLASDSLFAAAFALAALLTARLVEQPTYARSAAVGLAIALLVLVRPVGQVLVLLLPAVLLLPGAWRVRFGRTGVLAAALLVPLLGWATHNAVRAHDFTIVRGGGHAVPLFRAYVEHGIVDPDNGEASRELARAVARDLLQREPYRSYGIGLEEFFTSRSARMHEDLAGLSDRTWGWDDDYAHLARVGREAVFEHPGTFVGGVARDAWRLLWWPVFLPVGTDEPSEPAAASPSSGGVPAGLPVPSEGQPIPAASVSGFISTPDGRFREVWTSPTEHAILADDPSDSAHLDALNRRVAELYANFSDRDGNYDLGAWFNRASRWFPRPMFWLALGLVACAIRRPRGLATPVVLSCAALLVIAGTSLAVPAAAEYSTPVAPAFVLLAAGSLLAERRPRHRTGPA
jgi:Dolichyl-phosphate-mannose-protein mannosyltransferase